MERQSDAMSREPANVLLVDDDQEFLRWLQQELARRGYAVTAVDSPDAAVSAAAEQTFALAIVDLKMPSRSGIETMVELRRLQPELETLLVTAYGSVPAAVAALKGGAADFIEKPFTIRDLLPRMDEALARRRRRMSATPGEVCLRLLAIEDERPLLEMALLAIDEAVPFVQGAFLLEDSTPPGQVVGSPPVQAASAERDLMRHLHGVSLEASRPLLLTAAPQDTWNASAPHYTGALLLPLRAPQGPFGTLLLLRTAEQDPFDAEALALAGELTSQVVLAVEHARLRQRHAAAGRELDSARAALLHTARMAVAGRVTAQVAHEINNALSYVIANLAFVGAGLQAMTGEPAESGATVSLLRRRLCELARAVEDANEGADRLRAIARDLKAFSEGGSETGAPVDLRRVVEWSLRLVASEWRDRIAFVTDLQPVPLVEGNEMRLGQALVNLLLHAAKSFDHPSPDTAQVKVQLRADGESITLRVSDNGPALAPEVVRRIFEPNVTLRPAGPRHEPDLPICNGIIASHGGSMRVENGPDSGTSIVMRLPVCRPPERRAQRESAPRQAV